MLPSLRTSGTGDGGDYLTRFSRAANTETDVGPTGTLDIEAIAFWPGTTTLYAADADRLGTLSLSSGAYSNLGTFGSGDGAAGPITFSDVDSLDFDPLTFTLYGVHRREGSEDVLFVIDPDTGQHVSDAFGPGVDYVVVNTNTVGLPDLDDIAVDPVDGQLYGIANNTEGNDRLVKIDKATGSVTDVGRFRDGAGDLSDFEGLSFFNDGMLFATNGAGAPDGRLYDVDKGDRRCLERTLAPLQRLRGERLFDRARQRHLGSSLPGQRRQR